ncbi:MAG: hypothetical protein H7066_07100 [Cytophagaceae bacterium]|nr:hypothetical protein [Gemmatimonadaceae bacterium]
MHVPTTADVEAIAASTDPVLRNLRITQSYHELAQATATLTGSGANWCAFATWASKQAGLTIRSEDLERTADAILGSPLVRAGLERVLVHAAKYMQLDVSGIRELVRRTVDPVSVMRKASDAVSRGNLKVYAEIGREFARWIDSCSAEAAVDGAANTTFRDSLRDGDPPEGQRMLRDAFRAFAQARSAREDDARHEWILHGNLCVGLHEQTRLQPEIAESLNAAIDAPAIKQRLLAALLPGVWLRVRATVGRWLGMPLPLDVAIDDLLRAVQAEIRRVLTATLMTIHMPRGDIVRLGEDVRALPDERLRALVNPELVALVARFDRRVEDTVGSGAEDWASLPQRMHFITELFRSWHERAALYDPPFTERQLAQLAAGQRPAGTL